MAIAALCGAYFFGAISQRVTGLGAALVGTPFIVVALGPWDGVVAMQLAGLIMCSCLTILLWSDIDWRRAASILAPALVAVIPGVWLAANLPARVTSIVIACLVLVALTTVRSIGLTRPDAFWTRSAAGLGTGISTSLAGLGGPPLVVYARVTSWQTASFAATLQPVFLALSISTLGARWHFSGRLLPDVPLLAWCAGAAALASGLWAGGVVGRRLDTRQTTFAITMLAYIGALTVLLRASL